MNIDTTHSEELWEVQLEEKTGGGKEERRWWYFGGKSEKIEDCLVLTIVKSM